MNILDLEPVYHKAENGNITLANFNLQVADGIRIHHLCFVHLPDGGKTVFASKSGDGRRHASFRSDVREQIVALVDAQLSAGW